MLLNPYFFQALKFLEPSLFSIVFFGRTKHPIDSTLQPQGLARKFVEGKPQAATLKDTPVGGLPVMASV